MELLQPQTELKTRADFLKYARDITLDPNTANICLLLSNGNRKVELTEEDQPYPSHPDRFTEWNQVLSKESLTGRCYWEVEWGESEGSLGVAYRARSWYDSRIGDNDKSWALHCYRNRYTFMFNGQTSFLSGRVSSRIGVYVDHRACHILKPKICHCLQIHSLFC